MSHEETTTVVSGHRDAAQQHGPSCTDQATQTAPIIIHDPFKGDGSQEISLWLAGFDRKAEELHMTMEEKFRFLPSLLTGQAGEWYRSTLQVLRHSSYEELVIALMAKFPDASIQSPIHETTLFEMFNAPDFNKRFHLRAGAGANGVIRGLLMQEGEDGLYPVAYAGRHLSVGEQTFPPHEQECLGVIWALGHFQHYVEDAEFELMTDIEMLRTVYQNPASSSRVLRWIAFLDTFQFHLTSIRRFSADQ